MKEEIIDDLTLEIKVIKAPLLSNSLSDTLRQMIKKGYKTIEDRTNYEKEITCIIMANKKDLEKLN